MNETIEELKKNHIRNYKNALFENVKNNTNVLVDEDIMSLLKKPPLDSMDIIKSKFLDLAKKNKIILNTENLNNIMDKYREDLVKICCELKKVRIDSLDIKIEEFNFEKDNDVFKLVKKDFVSINKNIKKLVKEHVNKYLEKDILKKVESLFLDNVDLDVRNKIILEFTKY